MTKRVFIFSEFSGALFWFSRVFFVCAFPSVKSPRGKIEPPCIFPPAVNQRTAIYNQEKGPLFIILYYVPLINNPYEYAVKAKTSLAPLSWCGPLRLVHANLLRTCTNVSRFQSYAKSRRLHAIANEIDMWNLQSVNRIPGIHDNGPPRTTLWRLTLTSYSKWTLSLRIDKALILANIIWDYES